MGEKISYTSVAGDESVHAAFERGLDGAGDLLGRSHPMHIGGEEVTLPATFEVRSPIDRTIRVGVFPAGGEAEARRAVAAAAKGAAIWEQADWKERTRVLSASADLLEDRKFLLAALVSVEVGKPRLEAIAEMAEAVDMIRYYCRTYSGAGGYIREMASAGAGEESGSVMRPYGVFAVISPFNFPVALAAGMIAGALITGNGVVFKPASAAPLSGLGLFRALRDGGVPGEVLQFVTGPGKPFGEVVVSHRQVDGIAFTGSREAGMWLHRSLAEHQPCIRPLVAEMGSKNPVIVTARADLADAAEGVMRSAFGYSGQKCSATSRVYVDTTVAAEFVRLLKARTVALTVGDPRERETFLGPLIDGAALAKYRRAAEEARNDGGSVVTGGNVLGGGLFDRGHYVEPAIVTGLPPGHRLEREELFVPLVLVRPVSGLDAAIDAANDTGYGLTSGIFSKDPAEVSAFFSRVRFGVAYANRKGGATTGAWPGSQPFAGWNGSGSTGKGAGGPYYLLSFLREQSQTRVRG